MRIGYYQFRPSFGQVKKNTVRILHALHDAEADLIVLPELCFTGYYFKDRSECLALAEDPSDSSIVESLGVLCRQKGMHLVTGFAELKGDKVYNSALLIGPEGLIHTYRKLHLFNKEKNWFDPGDTPLSVQHIKGVGIGMMICFDWIFPEVARTLVLQGAQLICHPSNLVLNYCQEAMRTRCIENMVFAVTANRCGADKRPHGELKFTGQSQITAPKGLVLHRAPQGRETLFIAEIDPSQANNKKLTPLNDLLEDRRPLYYKSEI